MVWTRDGRSASRSSGRRQTQDCHRERCCDHVVLYGAAARTEVREVGDTAGVHVGLNKDESDVESRHPVSAAASR